MQALSTSIVSLHSHVGSLSINEKSSKNKKISQGKPSFVYFLAILYTFLSMGLGVGLIGPTLLKFSEQLNEPLSRTVYLLFTRSAGFLVGTLLGGNLIDFFPSLGRTFLAISVLLMAVTTLIFPLIFNLIPMIVLHALWSLGAGSVDNLAQILTIRHYESRNVNPYLQALHGAFGVGAFLSPLIIAPFLQKHSPVGQWHYAYWIIGALQLPNFFWIFFFAIRDEICAKNEIEEKSAEMKEFVDDKEQEILPTVKIETPVEVTEKLTLWKILILSLTAIFIFLYVGSESGFGAYLHTFASLHLKFEKDRAAYLNSAFWASFAVGRLGGVLLSIKFSPFQMIATDLIGSLIPLTIIFFWNHSPLILWIGSILYGFAAATIYASIIAYTEEHISITGKRMSLIAVAGSAGDGVIPLIIGYCINVESIGPLALIIVVLIVTAFSTILFAFIVLCVRRRTKSTTAEEQNKK